MAATPRRLKSAFGALFLCLLLSASALAAGPGSLDPGFGKKGVVRIGDGKVDTGEWPDLAMVGGKPVVLTEASDGRSALFFLKRNGSRETAVRGTGVVVLERGDWRRLAVQPDGKIVLAGSVDNVPAVMRLDLTGAPDPTFSGDGIAEVPLPQPPSTEPRASEDYFGQIQVRGDGMILALRSPITCVDWCTASRGAVVAIRPDGTLEDAFGTAGTTWLPAPISGPPPGSIYRVGALAIRGDGGLLVGATMGGKLTVFGFTPAGAPDPAWGGDGIVHSDIEFHEDLEGWETSVSYGEARSILVRNDNRVYVVADASVLALKADGSVESGFGERGIVYTADLASEQIEFGDGVIDASGRLVLGGEYLERSTVVRLRPNGRLDPKFAGVGIVDLDLSTKASKDRLNEAVTSVAVGNGIFTAGWSYVNKRFLPTLTRLR